jgi:serine/threonine protein kinase
VFFSSFVQIFFLNSGALFVARRIQDYFACGGSPAIPTQEILRLIQQLFVALFSLHRVDVIHGDIGPHSVYLVQAGPSGIGIRLGDVSRVPRSRSCGTTSRPSDGSLVFTQRRGSTPNIETRRKSPDSVHAGISQTSFEERKRELTINKQNDVLAAACTMYYMLSAGRFPFDVSSQEERYTQTVLSLSYCHICEFVSSLL